MPYVALEDIVKDSGRFADEFRAKPQKVLATKFRFTSEHVLYGKLRPYLNKVALPYFAGVCTTEILPLRPKPGKIERGYLYAVLLSPRFVNWASQNVSGANLPRLGPDRLLEFEIPLPDLAEQKRIAAILERADRLRRLRRYAVEMADQFPRDAFMHLFGALDQNRSKWPQEDLGELCEKVIDCPHSTPIYAARVTAHPCARSSDIQNGFLDWTDAKYVGPEEYETRIARGSPLPGDVIYCREGARFGNAAQVVDNTKLCLGQRMMLFRVDRKKVTAEFVWGFLSSDVGYGHAAKALDGSASPHVNIKEIVAFRVPVPPLELQQEYTRIVQRQLVLRAIHRESLRQAEHLFQTLLHRAFTSGL
jgi:type I restriction enzyme S subunit